MARTGVDTRLGWRGDAQVAGALWCAIGSHWPICFLFEPGRAAFRSARYRDRAPIGKN